eukprot:augustus_masked-scaffold_2-processed-gene-13.56-mRNA-1 protein AED:1.00 eAED:1.00 QI:0/0/0/0/1/1/2/0/581
MKFFRVFASVVFLTLTAAKSMIKLDCQNEAKKSTPWQDVYKSILSRSTSSHRTRLFRNSVAPFAEMVRLSYNAEENETPVDSYSLITSSRPEIGLNSIAYLHLPDPKFSPFRLAADENTPLDLVIVFRGSHTDSDFCADQILWNLTGHTNKEAEEKYNCKRFTPEELDYVSQAKSFVTTVLSSELLSQAKTIRILLSGHSLGAGLSEFMSYFYNNFEQLDRVSLVTALSFSSPGIKSIINEEKYSLVHKKVNEKGCVLQIYNPWDPIVGLTRFNQKGYMCAWSLKEVNRTKDCVECYASIKLKPKIEECGKCEQETHLFFHYEDAIKTYSAPKSSKILFVAKCKEKRIGYRLELTTLHELEERDLVSGENDIVDDNLGHSWEKSSVGRGVLSIRKKEKGKWKKLLLNKEDKQKNMHVWFKLKEKYEEEFKEFEKNRTGTKSSDEVPKLTPTNNGDFKVSNSEKPIEESNKKEVESNDKENIKLKKKIKAMRKKLNKEKKKKIKDIENEIKDLEKKKKNLDEEYKKKISEAENNLTVSKDSKEPEEESEGILSSMGKMIFGDKDEEEGKVKVQSEKEEEKEL